LTPAQLRLRRVQARAGHVAGIVLPPVVMLGLLGVVWQVLCSSPDASLPPPTKVLADTHELITRPFYDNGGNDKGLFWHLLASLKRVALGYSLAATIGIALGALIGGSKWAMRGITQCWQADLRPHGIRVICICPSEVQTNWMGKSGRNNPNKLYAEDIGATIMAALTMPRRALWPELAVFANNPWKED